MVRETEKVYQEFRIKHSIKVAIVIVICVTVATAAHLKYTFFSAFSALVLMINYHQDVVIVGIKRVLGPIIATVIMLILARLLINDFLVFLLSVAVLIIILSYMAGTQKFASVGVFSTIIVAFLVAENLEAPQGLVSSVAYVSAELVIGFLAVLIVQYTLWPKFSAAALDPMLYDTLNTLTEYFTQKASNLSLASKNAFSKNFIRMLDVYGYAQTSKGYVLGHYQRLIILTRYLTRQSFILLEDYQHLNSDLIAELSLNEIYQAFEQIIPTLKDFSRAIKDNTKLQNENIKQINQFINTIRARMIELRIKDAFKEYPYDDVISLLTFYSELRFFNFTLQKIHDLIPHRWEQKEFEKDSKLLKKFAKHPQKKPKASNWNFQLNLKSLQTCVRISLGVFSVFILNYYIHLPALPQTLMGIIIITASPNLGKYTSRTLQSVLGIFSGFVVGVIFLLLSVYITHFPFLLALVFSGMFFAAYIALGPEPTSLAGVLFGVMIPITLFASTTPGGDLTFATDRVIGLLQGIVLGTIIMTLIWPINPLKEFRMHLAKLMKHFQGLLQFIFIDHIKINSVFFATVQDDIKEAFELISDSYYLPNYDKITVQSYQYITNSLLQLYEQLSYICSHISKISPELSNKFFTPIDALNAKVIKLLVEAEIAISKNIGNTHFEESFHQIVKKYEQDLEPIKRTRQARQLSIDDLELYTSIIHDIYVIVTKFGKILVQIDELSRVNSKMQFQTRSLNNSLASK